MCKHVWDYSNALGYEGFKMEGQALVGDLGAEECSSDPNSYS